MKPEARSSPSHPSPARVAAFDILLRVEGEASYASELLHSQALERLSIADHALATELVMGVLRWRSLIDSIISEGSAQRLSKLDLEVLVTLRLAIYQLRWLSRIPARAAIHESVELVKRARKRSAATFVNAVLRKLANSSRSRDGTSPLQAIAPTSPPELARDSAHPAWLVERWAKQYGIETAAKICRHNQQVPVTAIRLRSDDAEHELAAEGINLFPGALLTSARRVQSGDVTSTRALRGQKCAVQDEASQLIASLVGHGTRVLDCCAAPGGKTIAIADNNPTAHITAVELHPHRADLLRTMLGTHTATAALLPNVRVLTADATNLPFSDNFDRVLADVPCSGTGTLARNPEIKWRLSPEDLADLQQRQLAILRSAILHLGDGGRLIYSTCSLEREENEDVVEQVLEDSTAFRLMDCGAELDRLKNEGKLAWPDLPSLTAGHYLRTLPGVHPCDGFFAAILEKV